MGGRLLTGTVVPLSAILAICSCATTTPDPTVSLIREPTAFPTNLPFEPQITMPPRATPTLQPPSLTFRPGGPLTLPTLIAAPTEASLPHGCLLPAFAGILEKLPGRTVYDTQLEVDPENAHVRGYQVIDYTNTDRECRETCGRHGRSCTI